MRAPPATRAREIVQSLIESGHLHGTRGAYRVTTPVEQLPLPATVQAVLAARIDRLGERDKQVLQTAAVIGKEFSEPVLRAVLFPPQGDSPPPSPEEELAATLHTLISAEFIYEQALYPVAEYSFKHPLTQEVALHSQLGDRRRRTHAVVARALADLHADKLDEHAALLAHHWEAAGEALEAARWHRRAAQWLVVHDPLQACAHWRRVAALADGLPLVREALEHGLRARSMLLNLSWRAGISDEAIETLAAEGRSLAERLGDRRGLCAIESGAVFSRYLNGHVSDTLEPVRQLVKTADDLGDRAVCVDARANLMEVCMSAGHLREALRVGEGTRDLAAGDWALGVEISGVPSPIWSLAGTGWIQCQMGQPGDALKSLDEALRLAREHDQSELVSWALGLYVTLETTAGVARQGMQRAQQAVELAERAGSPIGRALAYWSLGAAQLQAGEPRGALEALESGWAIARERGVVRQLWALWLANLAEAYMATQDLQRARATVEDAVRVGRDNGTRVWEARAHLARARVLRQLDGAAAREEIAASLARAEALIRDTEARAYAPFVEEERARLATLLGDTPDAQQHLRAAHRLFTEVEATGHAERVAKELVS